MTAAHHLTLSFNTADYFSKSVEPGLVLLDDKIKTHSMFPTVQNWITPALANNLATGALILSYPLYRRDQQKSDLILKEALKLFVLEDGKQVEMKWEDAKMGMIVIAKVKNPNL